jgi:hypothetical protein
MPIDPVQTKTDLNAAIVFGESSLDRAPFFLVPQEEAAPMQRLLAQLQTIVNDPVKWPALVAWLNNLGSTP